ncbi:MAG: LamG domain-containing protein [Actinomycetota bacterium]|nr:LamG domain-containing protein [Actinomycetota bacterium]
MKRHLSFAATVTLTLIVSVALVSTASTAGAKLKADYRFEGSLRNSVGSAAKLTREGPGAVFLHKQVKGSRDGVWSWPEGTGLRLDGARKAVGPGKGTYTFVMLVRLDNVDGYRKLIHFKDLADDDGFYVDDGTLYPYDLDYSAVVVQPATWYQIAVTRDSSKVVRVYVDGARVLRVADPTGTQVLGPDNFFRFLRDDESTATEESGGMIARLRIYNGPLSGKRLKNLPY